MIDNKKLIEENSQLRIQNMTQSIEIQCLREKLNHLYSAMYESLPGGYTDGQLAPYIASVDGRDYLVIARHGLNRDDFEGVFCLMTPVESMNKTDIENARRIVACMNACKPYKTEELEKAGSYGELALGLAKQCDELQVQNTELIEAIREAMLGIRAANDAYGVLNRAIHGK